MKQLFISEMKWVFTVNKELKAIGWPKMTQVRLDCFSENTLECMSTTNLLNLPVWKVSFPLLEQVCQITLDSNPLPLAVLYHLLVSFVSRAALPVREGGTVQE